MPFKKAPALYAVWQGMIQRCTNPNYRQFKDYGGRGITVCAQWRHSYATFAADMGDRPPNTVIDRIDNDRGYSPENCRWATRRQSQLNRRIKSIVTIGGHTYRTILLAEKSGLKADTIIERAAQGLSYSEVIDPARRVFHKGLALGGHANGAKRRSMTHCKAGHEFSEANTYLWRYKGKDFRQCRACHAERSRKRRHG